MESASLPVGFYQTLLSILDISYQLLNSLWILLGSPKTQLLLPASDLMWEPQEGDILHKALSLNLTPTLLGFIIFPLDSEAEQD